jgi:DNA-binding NarL/FixJ family response regulator
MISEGERVAVIAGTLGYSDSTIKATLRAAMRRLGARNRTQAVAIAIRAGVL